MFLAPFMLQSRIFRQSWPNVVERKVRFHFFTLNLNNNSPLPPTQCCLGLFSARNKNHTISFINASINIEKGARGSSFFCEICENITTRAPLRTNQLAFHKLLAMIVDATTHMKFFWEEQMRLLQSSSCGRRYHLQIIRFALSLHGKSPSARESGALVLPSERVLQEISDTLSLLWMK